MCDWGIQRAETRVVHDKNFGLDMATNGVDLNLKALSGVTINSARAPHS